MNLKDKLLAFLNQEKKEIVGKITESFKVQQETEDKRQNELRIQFLGGMNPNDFITSFHNCFDGRVRKEKQRNYQKFLDNGGIRRDKLQAPNWMFEKALQKEVRKINNLISFIESEYYENDYSILDKFDELEAAEIRLSNIREQFLS